MLNTCYSRNYADFTGKGYFSQPFFESVVLWTVLPVAMLCFRQLR